MISSPINFEVLLASGSGYASSLSVLKARSWLGSTKNLYPVEIRLKCKLLKLNTITEARSFKSGRHLEK